MAADMQGVWQQTARERLATGLRARRVTQLDARELDSELVNVLTASLSSVVESFQPSFGAKYEPELRTLVTAAILPKSGSHATPGMSIQRLGYRALPVGTPARHATEAGRLRVWAFTLCHVVWEWAHHRWDALCNIERLRALCSSPWWWWLTLAWRAAALGNFLVFLLNGRYAGLIERLCGVTVVHNTVVDAEARTPSYDYIVRDLLYTAFTGAATALVTMADWGRLTRRGRSYGRMARLQVAKWLAVWWQRFRAFARRGTPEAISSVTSDDDGVGTGGASGVVATKTATADAEAAGDTPASPPALLSGTRIARCMMCGANPPTMPYVTQCGHHACYYCLHSAVHGDPSFACVTCGERVTSSQRC